MLEACRLECNSARYSHQGTSGKTNSGYQRFPNWSSQGGKSNEKVSNLQMIMNTYRYRARALVTFASNIRKVENVPDDVYAYLSKTEVRIRSYV